MKKKTMALLLALIMTLSLAACGGSPGKSGGDTGTAGSETTGPGTSGTAPAESGTTVGADGTVTTQYAGTEVNTDKEKPKCGRICG